MKRILALFCLALTAAPVGAQADTLHNLVQGLDTAVVIKIGGDQERRRGRDRDDREDRGNRGGSNWRDSRDDDRGGYDRPREDRNDGRINRARAIASSRGRVLDAGQQSGSIFWVRVATANGRVDLLVDADSGRIIGER
jgi:hypothetical protein